MNDYQEQLKLKYPVGQSFGLKGYYFIFAKQYGRGRFKAKLDKPSRLDFTGEKFSISGITYEIVKKKDNNTYIIKENKK